MTVTETDRRAFAERVNTLREARGLSWKELAAKVGSVAALRRWKGARALPRIEAIVELSHAFGVTTDYLLTGRDSIYPACADPHYANLKEAIERTPRFLREALAGAILGHSVTPAEKGKLG